MSISFRQGVPDHALTVAAVPAELAESAARRVRYAGAMLQMLRPNGNG
jgi:hypothetical protein